MPVASVKAGDRWSSAWPDALAFLGGLGLAWFQGWQTKDLVWSLWLSSLGVGYAMLVWSIFGPTGRAIAQLNANQASAAAQAPVLTVMAVGGLFMLAFFTVHFGGFHFVHSVFLNQFFPVVAGHPGLPGKEVYGTVVREYWPFVLLAAVAERQAFKLPSAERADDGSVTAEAIEQRKARQGTGGALMAPYKNVIRLHLLIFFFAFASFTHVENFLVYAVVYAVYFFPWRLLSFRRPATTA